VAALEAAYEERLTQMRIVDLPAAPRFVLCATDMAFGVNWIFERTRVGDYQAGYMPPPADCRSHAPLQRHRAFRPSSIRCRSASTPRSSREDRRRAGPNETRS
jgi:hypothetical protein